MGSRGNKFQCSENCVNLGKISSSFLIHRYFQVFHMNLNICFCQKMICFEKISKQPHRSLQYNAITLALGFCPLVTRTSSGFPLNHDLTAIKCHKSIDGRSSPEDLTTPISYV